ncbi:MAG: hypothetical protein RLO51_08280 [Thalassobaculum sp.]|uniref:outer membrane protein n=1 Tax=Thalassobaculum sp. TaxID=2022740 RepID=UPI0032F072EA
MVQNFEGGKGIVRLAAGPAFRTPPHAEGGELAAQPHSRRLMTPLAILFAGAVLCASGAAVADDKSVPAPASSTTWYIVGGPDSAEPRSGNALSLEPRPARIGVGVSFSRLSPGNVITFTAGSSSPRSEPDGSYAFLVSGAYDFDTGTLVTPRVVGGVGVSYLGADRTTSLVGGTDPTARREMAPTAQIGFGADFDLGDSWAVSAEYRAMYLGETERPGSLGESRLDQKFTVGAKIRF